MPKNVLNFYSKKEKLEYDDWKNKIANSGYPGTKKLIKRLNADQEGTEEKNFLETLCEFNVAKTLMEKGEEFEYEAKGKDDFSFNGITLSIKSIQTKEYQEKESETVKELLKTSDKSQTSLTRILPYKQGDRNNEKPKLNESVSIEITRSKNSYIVERWESSYAGEPSKSEYKQKGVLLEHLAGFEQKNIKEKKVILFFKQVPGVNKTFLKDVANWYFGKTRKNDHCLKYYNQMFKLRRNTFPCNKNNSIVAIIYLTKPINALIWQEGVFDYELERMMIYSNNETLTDKLKKIFS